ncbi:MAG: PP2C family protein-serine/threonine phosphatase [Bacteroidia bacterium]|nr:PP2C family protein-serine/threonine phosphatase [Bacteroidia bacterium]
MATPSHKSFSRSQLMEIKLSSLLQVTKAINNNFSTNELLEIFEKVVREQLNIGRLVLLSHDGSWKTLISFGVDKVPEFDVDQKLGGIEGITFTNIFDETAKQHSDAVVPVFHKSSPLAYVLIGDINEQELEMSPIIKHLPFIQTLTNIIVVAVENKKLFKENLKQAAITKELELASEMQNMLFPSSLPSDKNMDIAAFYLPHRQVGGDYYDFIRLNENEVAFCMADVSGKGVAAALLMSNFQANLRILLRHMNSLTDLVRELNAIVMDNAKGEKFITFFIARYNQVTKMLNYINAGHNPPVLLSGNTTTLLRTGCTGLGMLDEIPRIREGLVHLQPPSTVVCYTDGVVEVENNSGVEFGTGSLEQVMMNHRDLSMEELNAMIIKKLDVFRESQSYIDDITLFSARFF